MRQTTYQEQIRGPLKAVVERILLPKTPRFFKAKLECGHVLSHVDIACYKSLRCRCFECGEAADANQMTEPPKQ